MEIAETRKKLNLMYEDMQKLPFQEFQNLHAKAKKAEERLQCTITKNMERKVQVFRMKERHPPLIYTQAPTLMKEKRRRHNKTRRYARKKYEKNKRHRQQAERRLLTSKEVQKIKESNLVKNFSSEDVPDEAYLYLALGSQFCPTKVPKMHDYTFDTKTFCRKLAWSAYHEHRRKETEHYDQNSDSSTSTDSDWEASGPILGCPQKLKIKSRQLPEFSDNLLTHVTETIKEGIKNITLPAKRKRNLTILEAKGQKWCKKAISDKRLYITKVDKGGCILILNAVEVDRIMRETLNDSERFEELAKDPRNTLKIDIKNMTSGFQKRNLLSPEEVFAISGQTKRGGMSRGHDFVLGKPYIYPL